VRNLSASIPTNEWKNILQDLLRVLRPNGLIEVFDSAGEYDNAGTSQRTFWGIQSKRLRATMNMDPTVYGDFGPWLEQAGFTTVQHVQVLHPMGPWAGNLGKITQNLYKGVLQGMKVRLVSSGLADLQETDEALVARMQEIDSGQESIVWNVYIGRKPLGAV
jgi:hypothetical protein